MIKWHINYFNLYETVHLMIQSAHRQFFCDVFFFLDEHKSKHGVQEQAQNCRL